MKKFLDCLFTQLFIISTVGLGVSVFWFVSALLDVAKYDGLLWAFCISLFVWVSSILGMLHLHPELME